jgi:hypothetical protein
MDCLSAEGNDLCEKYASLYGICVGLAAGDRNLDIDDCYFGGYGDKTSCEAAECTWHGDPYNKCVSPICIGDTTFDGKVKGKDKSVTSKDYGRMGCPASQ